MHDTHPGGDPTVEQRGVLSKLGSFEQVIVNIAFIILFVTISWGVLSRYVVTTPSSWVEEISSFCFTWLIFVGAAEVHRRGQHVSVDLLTSRLSNKAQRILAMVIEAALIGFCLYVAQLGVRESLAMHSSTTSMLRLPLSIGFSGLTLGFVMMGLRGIQRFRHMIGVHAQVKASETV